MILFVARFLLRLYLLTMINKIVNSESTETVNQISLSIACHIRIRRLDHEINMKISKCLF